MIECQECIANIIINIQYALRQDHQYYYQCQLQLMVTERAYCDFIVWTPNELHIQRILPNKEFIQSQIDKAEHFLKLQLCLNC